MFARPNLIALTGPSERLFGAGGFDLSAVLSPDLFFIQRNATSRNRVTR